MILEKVSAKRSWKRHIFPHMEAEKQSDFGKHHIHKVLEKCTSLEKAKVAFLYNHVSPMTRGKDLDFSLKNACFAAPEILIFLLVSYGQNHHFLH